ncbi:Uncharacterised protein [Mycobacterium tuberculosis]|nr:Uncharacterised protein [Mycobacterium tuberculosis]
MAKEFRLTHDPVFQLNACLWLVRKVPSSVHGPKPFYAEEGFVLRGIGQKLGVAETLRATFRTLKWSPDAPEPDVLLHHSVSRDHLVIECKAHSFSPTSSTAMQGRKLLSVCAIPAAAVGAEDGTQAKAIVVYALPAEDAELQRETIKKLSEELTANDLNPAASGTLGLSIHDGGLWAELTVEGIEESSVVARICRQCWITDGDEQDARPIYLIPYDPTAADNQTEEELDYCSRMLSERILTYAMSVVGRTEVPDYVYIMANDALRHATFRLSDRWHARELDKLRRRIAQELGSTLNKGALHGKVVTRKQSVEVDLATVEDQQAALGLLHKAQVQHISRQLIDPQIQINEEEQANADASNGS